MVSTNHAPCNLPLVVSKGHHMWTNIVAMRKKMFFSIPHHSFCHQFCVSLNICTLYHRLTVRFHKTSPCHLYKRRTEVDQDGSHQTITLQVGIFASCRHLQEYLGDPQDILSLHFVDEYPKQRQNHFNMAKIMQIM